MAESDGTRRSPRLVAREEAQVKVYELLEKLKFARWTYFQCRDLWLYSGDQGDFDAMCQQKRLVRSLTEEVREMGLEITVPAVDQ